MTNYAARPVRIVPTTKCHFVIQEADGTVVPFNRDGYRDIPSLAQAVRRNGYFLTITDRMGASEFDATLRFGNVHNTTRHSVMDRMGEYEASRVPAPAASEPAPAAPCYHCRGSGEDTGADGRVIDCRDCGGTGEAETFLPEEDDDATAPAPGVICKANGDHGWTANYGWIVFGIAGGWMWSVQSERTGDEVATGKAATKGEAGAAAQAWCENAEQPAAPAPATPLPCHLIPTPSGRIAFAGRVPADLAFEVSNPDFVTLALQCGPGLAETVAKREGGTFRKLSWATEADAYAYAAGLGYAVPCSAAPAPAMVPQPAEEAPARIYFADLNPARGARGEAPWRVFYREGAARFATAVRGSRAKCERWVRKANLPALTA